MMSRFKQELSGELGDFWKKHAGKELQKTREDIASGQITIDENGVARNCIGRVVMSDLAEIIEMVSDKFDKEATEAARDKETKEFNVNEPDMGTSIQVMITDFINSYLTISVTGIAFIILFRKQFAS